MSKRTVLLIISVQLWAILSAVIGVPEIYAAINGLIFVLAVIESMIEDIKDHDYR